MTGIQLLAKAQIFHCVLFCPVGMWEFFPSSMVAKACWTITSREWGGLECIKVNLCCLSLGRFQVMGLTTEEMAFWNLTFRWPCIMIIVTVNQPDALTSLIYFWNKILHVSDSNPVHHQELFTVHTAMVYVIQVCWQLASRIRTEPVLSWSCSLAVFTVKNSWWWTEELSKTCWVLFQK